MLAKNLILQMWLRRHWHTPDYIELSLVLMEIQQPNVTPYSDDLETLEVYVRIAHC